MASSQTDVWTVLRMLEWGTAWFTQRGIPSPRLSIEWLLADALQTRRLNLYVQHDRPLAAAELAVVRDYVRQRARHVPLQYITGSTSFYNAEIRVAPGVLIPRPETEELVELILTKWDDTPRRVLDIGTGSGCIAVALAMERPSWEIHALDLSDEALTIARTNAQTNTVTVTFHQADLLNSASMPVGPWDLIVSNPPYIHHDESSSLEPQVRDHEPKLALFCNNRQEVYQSIGSYAEKTLQPEGSLYVELHLEHHLEEDAFFTQKHVQTTIFNDASKRRRFAEIHFQV